MTPLLMINCIRHFSYSWSGPTADGALDLPLIYLKKYQSNQLFSLTHKKPSLSLLYVDVTCNLYLSVIWKGRDNKFVVPRQQILSLFKMIIYKKSILSCKYFNIRTWFSIVFRNFWETTAWQSVSLSDCHQQWFFFFQKLYAFQIFLFSNLIEGKIFFLNTSLQKKGTFFMLKKL